MLKKKNPQHLNSQLLDLAVQQPLATLAHNCGSSLTISLNLKKAGKLPDFKQAHFLSLGAQVVNIFLSSTRPNKEEFNI